MKIGIIGYGVVGQAIDYTLREFYQVVKYDKFFACGKLEDIIATDMVFVSVPTPYNESKKAMNLDAIRETLDFLSRKKYAGVVIIKSTLPLGGFNELNKLYNLELQLQLYELLKKMVELILIFCLPVNLHFL